MRVRIKFSKTGALRFIGNLDLHTIWERASRRAQLPLVYSQGFHPQPKINIACPLPLGISSHCEMVDMRLSEDVDVAQLSTRLQAVMPSGIGITKVESVDEHSPALQTQVIAAEYEVTLTEAVEKSDLKRKVNELLASKSCLRERRGKVYDLRPLIEELAITSVPSPFGEEAEVTVFMRLSAREASTGRPDEVLAELGIPIELAHIQRTALIMSSH